ncbi:hypothetical protein JX266_009659 [Neoarthrinium moseri]|uniref:uncharacterized protein n=1 Tax=Neoarthrinium moseri TaxID=1658444 RepID=UPI001FDDD4BF|nr:uncharacterized protein JN550_006121 [Neoarthrinium moseri]KAI1844175.1 hypothetical protein JX266_009659 [Neoarthrinium moseri]KAI1869134.1 hypothetical protein JN550_006121 [Neoarthrinium moseri]
MASELPSGVLSNLASSVKNIVTGQPEETEVDASKAPAAKKVHQTVESHHDGTTVQKEKAAAVVHEDVKAHEHEKVDTVVDKDVHQDHYRTTIQPIQDKNVLATKHEYRENEAERDIDHRDNKAKEQAKREAAKFHNEKIVEDTTHSKERAPTKKEEHIHHHIHETVQPVIERETLQDKIIHTTNHIHETEHLNDKHHEAKVAPAISMADFEKGLGSQSGASVSSTVDSKQGKPQTRSATSTKNGQSGIAVDSKKRDTTSEAMDIDAATKVGKLDATEASNPLRQ